MNSVKDIIRSKTFMDIVGEKYAEKLATEPTIIGMMQERLDRFYGYADEAKGIEEHIFRNNGFLSSKSITFMPEEAVDQRAFESFKDADTFVVIYDCNGNMAKSLRKKFPNARIIIIDPWSWFIARLTKMGFECYNKEEDIPNMNTRPVVLINSPYTTGTQDASNLYEKHQKNAIMKLDPIAIAIWCPDSFLTGRSKLRLDMEKKYGKPVYVKWLNQKRDWRDSIRISTALNVWDERQQNDTTKVKARYTEEEYDVDFNGVYISTDSKEEFEYITKIQTQEKVVVKGFKPTGNKGKQIKIKVGDKFDIEDGLEYKSNNDSHRQVVSYLRSESCVDVPPGPSVPSKYRELNCRYSPSKDAGRSKKFGRYMRSGHTRWLVDIRYISRSLDSPALSLVPIIDLDELPDNFTDEDIFKHFNTPKSIQDKIVEMGDKSPY